MPPEFHDRETSQKITELSTIVVWFDAHQTRVGFEDWERLLDIAQRLNTLQARIYRKVSVRR